MQAIKQKRSKELVKWKMQRFVLKGKPTVSREMKQVEFLIRAYIIEYTLVAQGYEIC